MLLRFGRVVETPRPWFFYVQFRTLRTGFGLLYMFLIIIIFTPLTHKSVVKNYFTDSMTVE